MSKPAIVDAVEQNIIDIFERVGWAVMQVGPTVDDGDTRWFAYTIGLTVTFGWPELICFGLSDDVLQALLNNAVRELKENSMFPSEGLELNEVIAHGCIRLAAFSPSLFDDHLGCAMWFAHFKGLSQSDFGCLQLVWPDKSGRFPAEADCDPGVRQAQAPIRVHTARRSGGPQLN
jgi:hypothetical protein